jgi:hypothetical protein
MGTAYTVQDGDTLVTIAHAHGFRDWAPIWNHADNATLRAERRNPMVLAPGDTVMIPDKQTLSATCETNKKHRFVVKALTAHFKFNVRDSEGQPVAAAPYTLVVGEKTFEGSTGDGGVIEHEVPHDARTARLTVEIDGAEVAWTLDVGGLQPIGTVDGVKARLNNLGYAVGAIDDQLDDKAQAAIKHFQLDHGLPTTGDLDDATRKAIDQAYQGL